MIKGKSAEGITNQIGDGCGDRHIQADGSVTAPRIDCDGVSRAGTTHTCNGCASDARTGREGKVTEWRNGIHTRHGFREGDREDLHWLQLVGLGLTRLMEVTIGMAVAA